ncbi:hypothetical protein GE09DRAFT_1216810 [Coniochaeta sp. 2T2.1]|nr:hypothetical protein GE09DRAFT_1216810 [Coniochaeta sp. 2T2.1]
MSGHTAAKYSKCGRCGQRVVVCQAGSHGCMHPEVDASGWRICYVPCYCGNDYYPDTAKAATPLQPWEYKSDHPAYRPVEDCFDVEDGSIELSHVMNEEDGPYDHYQEPGESSSSAAAAAPAEQWWGLEEESEAVPDQVGDLADQLDSVALDDDEQGEIQPLAEPDQEFTYVDTYLKKGKHVCFTHNELEYKTSRGDWVWTECENESSGEIYSFFQNRIQPSILTRELPSTQRDSDYIETAEWKGKGADKGKGEDKGKGKGNEEGKGKGKGKENEEGKREREGKGKGKGKENEKQRDEEKDRNKDKRKRS